MDAGFKNVHCSEWTFMIANISEHGTESLIKVGDFFTRWATISCYRNALPQGLSS